MHTDVERMAQSCRLLYIRIQVGSATLLIFENRCMSIIRVDRMNHEIILKTDPEQFASLIVLSKTNSIVVRSRIFFE